MRSRALSGGTVVLSSITPMKENSGGNEEDLFASFWKAEAEENGAEREFESVDKAMERLGMSRFRSRFSLNEKEKEYVRTKGMAVIKTTCRRNCEKATGTGGNKKRRKTNAHAPRTSPGIHCAARHGVLLSRLF